MASCLSEELACSICLSLFTEPVVLLCGHSFCRECISLSLNSQPHCPNCRSPVQDQDLRSSHVLKTLVEKAKETTRQKQEYRLDKEKAEFLCLEHDEKLKLFCITDQQLICVICRDSHKHDRHQFKPVSEASALVKTELQNLISTISSDTKALEALVTSQKQFIEKTKERSVELQTLVSSEFKQMYEFLRKRENDLQGKVKSDEEEALRKMNTNLSNIQEAKLENQTITENLTQILEITDTEPLLKMWSEDSKAKAAKASFKSKEDEFLEEEAELHLGPYESHLQMFVWKEMIQVVKRREEHLTLRSDKTSLSLSDDKCIASFCETNYVYQPSHSNGGLYNTKPIPLPLSTQSTNTFKEQHYWEVYVGVQSDWELGLPNTYLKNSSGQFQVLASRRSTSLEVGTKPQKVGLYLNCLRKELSFYNADTMELMHTTRFSSSLPVCAHFRLGQQRHNPLVIYKY